MELKLYMFETCPFCRKVINELEQTGRKDVVFCDIRKSEDHRSELIKVGGKAQVPCLLIDGMPLYESDDIIKWLRQNPA